MMNILYIIGNGFDLHHGINTHYSEYLKYLRKTDFSGSQIFYYLKNCFHGDLWNNFEEALGEFDINRFIEDNSHLTDKESDKMSDRFRLPDYAETIRKDLTIGLRNRFSRWILQLKKPTNISSLLLNLDKDAYFLTFNYTDTLESIYNISKKNILYVHNKAESYHDIRKPDDPNLDEESETDIILGHSPIQNIGKINNNYKGFAGWSVDDAIDKIKPYYKESEKQTYKIINSHRYFFNQEFLSNFELVIIIGHSLSDVDMEYFKEIEKHSNKNIKYIITYFGENEYEKIKKQSMKFIKNKRIKYKNIENCIKCKKQNI